MTTQATRPRHSMGIFSLRLLTSGSPASSNCILLLAAAAKKPCKVFSWLGMNEATARCSCSRVGFPIQLHGLSERVSSRKSKYEVNKSMAFLALAPGSACRQLLYSAISVDGLLHTWEYAITMARCAAARRPLRGGRWRRRAYYGSL